MKTDTPVTIRRADYTPPAFLVDDVALEFELDPAATSVRARLALRRNPAAAPDAPLRLDGDGLALAEKTPVTRALAARVLQQMTEPGLFPEE